MLTAEESGRVLGCTDRTVHTLANEGHLRRVRFPGRKLGNGFLESDVRALLAAGPRVVAAASLSLLLLGLLALGLLTLLGWA